MRKRKTTFFYDWSHIAGRESCQFLFWLMKNPMFYRAARPESGREARERFLRAALGRTQSERRRRLALAGGIRLSDGLE
jgi:hypothetical protein